VEIDITVFKWYSLPAPDHVVAESGVGYVNLTWEPSELNPDADIQGYKIYRGSFTGQILHDEVGPGTTFYQDTRNIINGQTYYYYVTAFNRTDESYKSEKVKVTLPGLPSAPYNLHTKAGDDHITLHWEPARDDGGSPVLRYHIYREDEEGRQKYLGSVSGDITTFKDGTVKEGEEYTYHVVAENAVGESRPSQSFSDETEEPEPPNPVCIIGVVFLLFIVLIFFGYRWEKQRRDRQTAREGGAPQDLSWRVSPVRDRQPKPGAPTGRRRDVSPDELLAWKKR
jgi:fibronectin type 3 domain-containing protein